MKYKNYTIGLLIAAIPAMAFVMIGCEPIPVFSPRPLTGTVSIQQPLVIDRHATAIEITNKREALTWLWEKSDDGGITWGKIDGDDDAIPITSPEFKVGDFVRVTVSCTAPEGTLISEPAEIRETITVTGITIEMVNSVPEIELRTSYTFTAVVEYEDAGGNPGDTAENQDVVWNIQELDYKNLTDGSSADLSSEFIRTSAAGIHILRIRNSDIWAPKLTITAASAFDFNKDHVSTPIVLEINWPFTQRDPYYENTITYGAHSWDAWLNPDDHEWGTCIAPDGKFAYFFENIKARWTTSGFYSPYFLFTPQMDLSGKSSVTFEAMAAGDILNDGVYAINVQCFNPGYMGQMSNPNIFYSNFEHYTYNLSELNQPAPSFEEFRILASTADGNNYNGIIYIRNIRFHDE